MISVRATWVAGGPLDPGRLVRANVRAHRRLGCRPMDRWEADRAAMLAELGAVAAREYPEGFWFDPVMRQIPDHFHCHARPKDGFFGPRKEK